MSDAIEVLKTEIVIAKRELVELEAIVPNGARVIIAREKLNGLHKALLALEQKEKLKKHLWENYGYDEDIPVEEVLKLIGETKEGVSK